MIFKLVKLVFLMLMTAVVGYFIVSKNSDAPHTNINSLLEKNSTQNIVYTKKLNGGLLTLSAAEVSVRSKDEISLLKVKAKFEKDKETTTIEGGKCIINFVKKDANLTDNVMIKSSDITCTTESATIDLVKNSIYGDSKITGTKGGYKITSDGFFIDQQGSIKLKHAKIRKE